MTQVQPWGRGDQPGLQGVLPAAAAGQAEEQEQGAHQLPPHPHSRGGQAGRHGRQAGQHNYD